MNGNKIRLLRKEKEYTIEQLADMTGFTASFISQLERNKVEPSLNALNKICNALEVSLYYFLEEQNEVALVTRKNKRKIISSDGKSDMSFITPISQKSGINPKFYVYEIILEPNQWESLDFISVNCQKSIIVKSGSIFVEFGTHNEILQDGDSILIEANLPHKCYNPTNSNVEMICIMSSLELI